MGGLDDWPWVDCQYVLVDVDVVLEAPDYLHTAGLGDILCSHAGLEEWRRRAALGQGAAFDPALAAQQVAHHESIATSFAATLDANGRMTEASVANIAQRIKERDSQHLKAPTESGDHPFLDRAGNGQPTDLDPRRASGPGGDDHHVVLRGGYGGVGAAAGLLSGALAA